MNTLSDLEKCTESIKKINKNNNLFSDSKDV